MYHKRNGQSYVHFLHIKCEFTNEFLVDYFSIK